MIYCKELNKEFNTETEMFTELVKNQKQIIDTKKSIVLKSCDKGASINAKPLTKLQEAVKSVDLDDNYYYIAVNSTNVLDSHKDVHLNGLWNKTAKEQRGKVYLVADHKLELDKVIARKENVEILIMDLPFSAIGKSYEGTTQVLVYKIAKDKIQSDNVRKWLDSGDAIEASVRMQYVNIKFCLNSDQKGYEDYKANYNKYYPLIANKSDFKEEIKYFYAVIEAKNVKESSLVLFGSNDVTGVIPTKNIEPLEDTQTPEAAKALQEQEQKNNFLNSLLNEKDEKNI